MRLGDPLCHKLDLLKNSLERRKEGEVEKIEVELENIETEARSTMLDIPHLTLPELKY